jgi:5-enolpyruvylshikimate-3-phosphate synthase
MSRSSPTDFTCGPAPSALVTADAAGDHWLAMALAIAALGAESFNHHGADSVAISYPEFFHAESLCDPSMSGRCVRALRVTS